MKSFVAIVGRPNVGKSTLFNRLVGRRLAIVEDVPGVTRDRHYADAEWGDRSFTVIDTGGFVPGEKDELLSAVREQAQLAVEECAVVLLVVDGRAGVTAADQEVANYLRRSGKPVVLAANKLDSPSVRQAAPGELYRLGLGEPFLISAEHAQGLDALLERLVELLPAAPPLEEAVPEGTIRVAIVGRPNVGKSTLINALLKEKRLVAGDLPGTTRDSIDTELVHAERRYILTDTAGIRRKRAIAQRVEQFAVVAALRAIERSDVAVLVLDATEAAVDQDARIAGIAEDKGRALLVVVNKWDKVPRDGRKEEELRTELKYRFKFISYAPLIFTSALTGAKVGKVLELSAQLFEQLNFRAPTPHLNRLLEQLVDSHPAPLAHGKPLRLYYIAQVSTAPPTFALTCNRPEMVPEGYKRYIVNQLREAFGLRVPIRLLFRERPGKSKRSLRRKPSKG